MKDCLLFLHGTYPTKHLVYYKKLCRGRFTIAVDGGFRFFKKTGLFPDILIGDFDSLKKIPKNLPPKTEVLRFPVEKNQTDAELALYYCFERKARRIDLIQPSAGEPDQFMGNFLLLTLTGQPVGRYNPEVRIINAEYEIILLENTRKIIPDAIGDTVSTLPLSRKVKYTCRGTAFDVRELMIKQGQSIGLRNKIIAPRAVFDITGQAFLIRTYAGDFGQKGA
ncbi:MAG: thiamine diphosphokinase [candidate division Zixibacteria bacterium]|nr:thiamine diphosphokinase [candidate division Zixibacteria bacterium]